jgi:hypothetical protein
LVDFIQGSEDLIKFRIKRDREQRYKKPPEINRIPIEFVAISTEENETDKSEINFSKKHNILKSFMKGKIE